MTERLTEILIEKLAEQVFEKLAVGLLVDLA
jgi:hypothetical protein